MKIILFLTTNFVWGGSEVLWTSVATNFANNGYKIKAIAGYSFQFLKSYPINENDFFLVSKKEEKLSFNKRIKQKLRLQEYSNESRFEKFLTSTKPLLAVISQGNNTEGAKYMELLCKYNIPFITITHLVVESAWPSQDDDRIKKLYNLFNKSKINFFVSKHVLQHHEKFVGYKSSNAKLLYNPFIKQTDEEVNFPDLINGKYCVALIGRLENFHKGYDLLIDVLSQAKWKNRNIIFDIYGNGPHRQLIERLISLNNVTNLFLKEHVENIGNVWKQHHILLMPSRFEGQSLTLIEAMRFKRAAIVTQVGGVEELVDDGITGFIAEFPQAKAIDDALERAWNKRSEWQQMGLNAYNNILQRHPGDAVAYFMEQVNPLLNA